MDRRDFIKSAALAVGMTPGLRLSGDSQARQSDEIAYSKHLPVKVETDVMVCGFAAAMAAGGDCDVHSVDVKVLQGKLLDFGAYLPNARI